MSVLAGGSRARVSAAVRVLRAQEWRPIVSKKIPNASHANRVSVPDKALKLYVCICVGSEIL